MAQQTAVDWFYQRILAEDIKSVYEQAKQMEKEQIIKSHQDGFLDALSFPNKRTADEYFKNTYKNG